jgi:hypothetical protein
MLTRILEIVRIFTRYILYLSYTDARNADSWHYLEDYTNTFLT